MSFSSTIHEARSGSRAALGEVLEACREYITAVATRRVPRHVHQRVRPSSLVQETYVRACGQFPRFRGESERQLMAWLRRIMVNCLLNQLRRPECRVAVAEFPPDCGGAGVPPADLAAANEATTATRRALDRLPTNYRLVIELHHFEGLAFEEIGLLLGRTGEAARKLWVRATAALGSELQGFR